MQAAESKLPWAGDKYRPYTGGRGLAEAADAAGVGAAGGGAGSDSSGANAQRVASTGTGGVADLLRAAAKDKTAPPTSASESAMLPVHSMHVPLAVRM